MGMGTSSVIFFFFQAEDGIRDYKVTGVQTCALPICGGSSHPRVVAASLERVFRDEWGRVLAGLIGFLGDFDLAEEAAQEAFAIAAERWPRDGIPRNPGAWLTTTARNRAINRINRDRTLLRQTRFLEVPEAVE